MSVVARRGDDRKLTAYYWAGMTVCGLSIVVIARVFGGWAVLWAVLAVAGAMVAGVAAGMRD
jgi:hypothetical protein